MKALDKRNETARQRQLKRDKPQPYYQYYVDSRRACPHCNAVLRRPQGPQYWQLECDCGMWTSEAIGHSMDLRYTPKEKINEAVIL